MEFLSWELGFGPKESWELGIGSKLGRELAFGTPFRTLLGGTLVTQHHIQLLSLNNNTPSGGEEGGIRYLATTITWKANRKYYFEDSFVITQRYTVQHDRNLCHDVYCL